MVYKPIMPQASPTSPQAAGALHPAIAVACALDLIFPAILALISRIARRIPAFAIPLNHRLIRAQRRLVAILHHIAAGTFPKPRAPQPPGRKGGPPAPYIPRRPGWLALIGDHPARGFASQLRTLLEAPATQAVLAAAPAHARAAFARALRTPCRLLAIDLPPVLQPAGPPPPPKPPAPRVRTPRAPRPPLFPPLEPYVRAAARALKPRFG
jgi:hypothetical protein